MRLSIALILILSLSSCGKFKFFKKSSEVKQTLKVEGTLEVRVFYEPGAEPYTDLVLTGLPLLKVWTVLDKNLKAMYPGKNIIVPMELSQMSPMEEKNEAIWTAQEIYNLGDTFGVSSSGDKTVLNVFFLNGRAENPNVIGLHLSNTKTMALFKEVIKSSGSGAVQKYVEQATLVHEVGHAVGLVNNGIPMVESHEDSTHIHHCSNPKCVMYWQNEGNAALMSFIAERINNPDLVMLDNQCLKDVTSHK